MQLHFRLNTRTWQSTIAFRGFGKSSIRAVRARAFAPLQHSLLMHGSGPGEQHPVWCLLVVLNFDSGLCSFSCCIRWIPILLSGIVLMVTALYNRWQY